MAWLTARWVTSKNCHICDHNEWIVADDLISPALLAEGGVSLGGTVYPQFMVICKNCGHTHYFNATVTRLGVGSDSGDT